MNAKGFTLVELLVACAIVIAIAGAVAVIVDPVRSTLVRAEEGIDLETGARAALDHVTVDVREAGSESGIAPAAAGLSDVLPPIRLLEGLESDVEVQPAHAIELWRAPYLGAQGRLSEAAFAGDGLLRLETDTTCSSGPPSCGFRPGDTALVFAAASGSSAEFVVIDSVGPGLVILRAPVGSTYQAGAILFRVLTTSYGLRDGTDGAQRLVRITDGGAEQPLVDHVVRFDVTADSADLATARLLSIRLRIQSAAAALRGPAGYLFARAGTARSATHWLPDAELSVDVALRNVGAWR